MMLSLKPTLKGQQLDPKMSEQRKSLFVKADKGAKKR